MFVDCHFGHNLPFSTATSNGECPSEAFLSGSALNSSNTAAASSKPNYFVYSNEIDLWNQLEY